MLIDFIKVERKILMRKAERLYKSVAESYPEINVDRLYKSRAENFESSTSFVRRCVATGLEN